MGEPTGNKSELLNKVKRALEVYVAETEGWRESIITDIAPVVFGETPIPGAAAIRFGFTAILTSEFAIPQLGRTNIVERERVRLTFVQLGNSVHTHSLTTVICGAGSDPPTHPGG